MALSDCSKCWDTPCTCGHMYKNYTEEGRIALIKAALVGTDTSTQKSILKKLRMDKFLLEPQT